MHQSFCDLKKVIANDKGHNFCMLYFWQFESDPRRWKLDNREDNQI